MSISPKISIVTPSYNQGQYLEDTILSVLGQGYPNLEYIIMDGGSTDNSVDIIKKYADRLTYWISRPDGGQAAAINAGFELATGVIFLWLNSDDLLMPNALNIIAAYVAKHGDKLYYGNCIHFKSHGKLLQAWGSDTGYGETVNLEEVDYIIQPASFWTRAIWQHTGPLNPNMHYAFDWEWFLRVKAGGYHLMAIPECLAMYRVHSQHKTATGGNKRQLEILSVYQKFCPDKAKLYTLLISDIGKQFQLKYKIVRKLYTMAGKNVSYGLLLKKFRVNAYSSYTAAEIDRTISML